MRLVIQDFQEDSHEGPSLKGRGSCEKSYDTMDNCVGSQESVEQRVAKKELYS